MNFNELKKLSREELESMVPKGFTFKTKPWTPQLAAFIASIANEGFLDNLDLGLGKTKVAIDTFRFAEWISKRKLKAFVICLNSAVEKWADEVYLHSDGIRATCLRGTTKEKWPLINGDGFFIINFEGLRWLVTERVPIGTTERGNVKNKQVIDQKLMRGFLGHRWDFLVIDESHELKNNKSLNYKIGNILSSQIENRLCLTGTVFGKTLLDIWSQYYVVDRGETYGSNFYSFRRGNFEDKGFLIRNIWKENWKPTREGEEYIRAKLWDKAIRYSEDEVDDLPEKNYSAIEYDLSKPQRADYLSLMSRENFDGGFAITNRHMVYRQVCGGFIKKSGKVYKNNPKLDVLWEIIEQAIYSSKIVVFHEFIKEGEMIEALLRKRKIKYCCLNGRVKDKHSQIKAFENNDKKKVMIAHPRSGGQSIDLVAAAYCAFFSNGGSHILRRQCEKRISRGGQVAPHVFYYDFMAKGTIEKSMLNNLKKGKDAFDRIIDGKSFKKALKGEL